MSEVYEGFATEGVKKDAPIGCSVDEVAVASIPAPLPKTSNESTTKIALVDTYNANDVKTALNTNDKIVNIINKSIVPFLRSRGYEDLQYMTDLNQFVDYGKAVSSLTANDIKDITNQFVLGAVKTRFVSTGVKKLQSVFLVDELRLGELLQISYRKTTREAHVNNAYALVDGAQYDTQTYYGFEVDTKVFGKPHSFRIVFSIPNKLYDTAFNSGDDLTKLYNYIISCADDDMTEKENGVLLTLYQSIIAKCNHTIEIDKEFSKRVLGTTGTSTNAHKTYAEIRASETLTRQFNAWLNELITSIGVGMGGHPNKKYNDGTVDTSTPNERRVIVLNSMFNSYLDNNKYSAFHEIGKPSVEIVDYWQTSGDELIPSLIDVTSIAYNNDGTLTTKNGIVGFIADKNLGGVFVKGEKTTSDYNGNGDFNTYYVNATSQRIHDTRANCVLLKLGSIGGSYS